MKRFLTVSAAAAALLAGPAVAQQVSPPADAAHAGVHGSATAQADVATPPVDASASATVTTDAATTAPSAHGEGHGSVTAQAADATPADVAAPPTATAEAEASTETQTAESESTASATTTASADATAAPAAETSTVATASADAPMPTRSVADVSVELPNQVAEVVEDGGYSTEDLVRAQLAAMMASNQTAQVEAEATSEAG